ncbi:MAG: glycogen/starch/alpha-glucan phosphorylase [Clostridia bacterium]|nr:glycogen/starch/alpha-glucan phosphorylase [Clostridia bacterium]
MKGYPMEKKSKTTATKKTVLRKASVKTGSPAKEQLRAEIIAKLRRHFGCELHDAGRTELFKACALVMRDHMAAELVQAQERRDQSRQKQVHYLSLEFLMGRSFLNNAYNMGMLENLKSILSDEGISLTDMMETEPDAGLGNGGLGRLAACYLDAMASTGLAATGYSIRYEHGLFKQVIVEGQQIELPDSWLDIGDVWLLPRMEEVREIRFNGTLHESWQSGRMVPELSNYTPVLAVPYDMLIRGYDTDNVCTLRLWSARSPVELDMNLFSRGEYLKALEQHAMAEVISKILYPDDKHIEGKSLRLKQQYFFVSATVQDIVAKHKALHGTLSNFADYHSIQINDTHPALVIPELMRILMDEEGYTWDDAWNIVVNTVSYTNHTVLPEALEQWPQHLFETIIPRIWDILHEINERYCAALWQRYPGDFDRISRMAIIADERVRMAYLSIAGSHKVNGVSALHSQILRDRVFADFAQYEPEKFTNVTNGIAHRRWLCQINPELTTLMQECIGDAFLKDPAAFNEFARFADDKAVRERLAAIKHGNKEKLAAYLRTTAGVQLDPDSLFDVQVKRLHEYKRQLLNVLHILHRYLCIKDNPHANWQKRTFLFGAKAFPGYQVAKQIIRLINSVANFIARDPEVSPYIKVVFMENYRVSLAERIMPAAELSEQISTAGKEASGTGNMKFMMNGALTIGTMDGANVEMYEAVGPENIFIFGLRAEEVAPVKAHYSPATIYQTSPAVRRVLDLINHGFGDGVSYRELVDSLLVGSNPDEYLLLADFADYVDTHKHVDEVYADRDAWNRMSIINIAGSGRFCADRAINDYARDIWNV